MRQQTKTVAAIAETDTEDDNFQSRATREGRDVQEKAQKVLAGCGFKDVKRNVKIGVAGITVNITAQNTHGRMWYFIVSGSWTSQRPGLMRTDTMFKVLGKSCVLSQERIEPIVLLATNLPNKNSEGDKALRATAGNVFFDAMEMMTADARRRLTIYARSDVVTAPIPGFWALEDLYGKDLTRPNILGASRSAPVAKTGDPLGKLGVELNITTRSLNHRLKVYIPSKAQDGTMVTSDCLNDVVRNVKSAMIEIGGGSTSYDATGQWLNPFGGIDEEPIVAIEPYLSDQPRANQVWRLVCPIVEGLDQAAVVILLDDTMYEFSRR